MSSNEVHVRIPERNIPMDISGGVLLDLYILMPASRRYIPFVRKGDKYNEDKKEKLKKHVLPDIFVIPSEYEAAKKIAANRHTFVQDEEHPDGFNSEVLGKKAEGELRKIYQDLLSDEVQDPQILVSSLQVSSDKILSIVAPESKDLTRVFFNNAKYVHLMNDASAIVSLAVLFAFANGFDSKKSYLELTQAALVMDVSLSNLGEDHRKLMYTNFDALPEEIKTFIYEHPKTSYTLVQKKLPGLSDATLQLILNHHELFNGRGYPRKVRTESLLPLVKVLALAVDVHDMLKKLQYEEKPVDLADLIFEVHDTKVDAHLRRHNRVLTQKILDFFNTQEAKSA